MDNQNTSTGSNASANDDNVLLCNFVGTDGRFILDEADWNDIQRYVKQGLSLPATANDFAKSFGKGISKDDTVATELITSYKKTQDACKEWETKTFDQVFKVAGDINLFVGKNMPVYYKKMIECAKILKDKKISEEDKADALEDLNEILDILKEMSQKFAKNADDARVSIETFAKSAETCATELGGVDGNGGIVKKFIDKCASSAELDALSRDIDAAKKDIEKYQTEYNRHVKIAATTPTYVLFFPIGLIPAIVVAGVYGDRAVKAKDKLNNTRADFATKSESLAAKLDAKLTAQMALTSMKETIEVANAAQKCLQKAANIWHSIKDDCDSIKETIKDNIEEVPNRFKIDGIEILNEQWTDIARMANGFRINAKITIAPAGTPPLQSNVA